MDVSLRSNLELSSRHTHRHKQAHARCVCSLDWYRGILVAQERVQNEGHCT